MYSLANRRTAGWRRRSLFNVCDLPKGLSSAGWRRHQPFDVCDLAKRLLPGSGQFYKPTEVSRQLLQVPSGNRRPQRTGVCASRRRISQVVDSLEHGILRSAQRVATVNSSCELTVGSLHRNLQKPTVRRALTVATHWPMVFPQDAQRAFEPQRGDLSQPRPTAWVKRPNPFQTASPEGARSVNRELSASLRMISG